MRDYALILIFLLSLLVGLYRPYYGLLVYAWVSYMFPHLLTSALLEAPVAKYTALSALAGIVYRDAWNKVPLRQRESIFMISLWGMFTISSFFAINPDSAWGRWQDASKLIVMALVMSMLLTDKGRVRNFLLVVAISLGFWGIKTGFSAVTSGGQFVVYGPESSILGGNNNIGLALNMALPLLWYVAHEERGLLKILLYSAFYFCIPAIMFTYSRASALTLPFVLLAILFKGKNRTLLVSSVLVGAILLVPAIPASFWNRQQTVLNYEADGSAMSRINNWRFIWALASDRPLTGGGFEFQTRDTVAKYDPEFLYNSKGALYDTHSIYFAMLGAHGFPGLFLYLAMIVSCFVSCQQMQWAVWNRRDLGWVKSYCCLVEVSFVAYLINGAFVNMEFFELTYDLVALVACLKIICQRELSETQYEERRPTDEMALAM